MAGLFTQALKDEIASYDMREWTGKIGETDVTLYAKPLAPVDVERVLNKYPDFMQAPQPAAMVNLICNKVVTEDGKKAFVLGVDGPLLKQAKIALTTDIFNALFGDDFEEGSFDEKVEESVKN